MANKVEELVLKTRDGPCCGQRNRSQQAQKQEAWLVFTWDREDSLVPTKQSDAPWPRAQWEPRGFSVIISDSMTEHQEAMQTRLPEAGDWRKLSHERNNCSALPSPPPSCSPKCQAILSILTFQVDLYITKKVWNKKEPTGGLRKWHILFSYTDWTGGLW